MKPIHAVIIGVSASLALGIGIYSFQHGQLAPQIDLGQTGYLTPGAVGTTPGMNSQAAVGEAVRHPFHQ
jgi:hypothetical protein